MPDTGTSSKSDGSSSQQVFSSSGLRIGGMCLNWKVIGGLAAVGLGVWVVAPNLVAGVVPLLLVAACPLSMILMMRGMSGGEQKPQTPTQPANETATPRDLATLKAEHARLSAELEALESDVVRARIEQTDSPGGAQDASSSTRASGSQGARGGDVA